MSDDRIASVSPTQILSRRRQLRRTRTLKLARSLWQFLSLGLLCGGIFWAVASPAWVVRVPEQIQVRGNEYLSARGIRSLLPLSYPQSVWAAHPQTIAEGLESYPPIARATVQRSLFPPSLTVEVRERPPVALARDPADVTSNSPKMGLLDESGQWMPLDSYQALARDRALPALKVVGRLEDYATAWPQVYRSLRHSKVPLSEIDWQDPSNLIVKTDLWAVHLGAYGDRFPQQMAALAHIDELARSQQLQVPKTISLGEIEFLNLKDPNTPYFQLKSVGNARE